MTKVEASPEGKRAPSLDLARIEEGRRVATWSRAACTFFPGLTVHDLKPNPALGTIQGVPFGEGHLWSIQSPPLCARYRPCAGGTESGQTFSVMLQLDGSTKVEQNRRSCMLRPSDFCVVDGQAPFQLEVSGPLSHVMFLQIPRRAVLSRHPYLQHQTAAVFDPTDGGAHLLRNLLLGIARCVQLLRDDQRGPALSAVAQLLGAPSPPARNFIEADWRVRTALALIESELADSKLTAARVAQQQGISRRRLDHIFVRTAGISVAAQIRSRRLVQAGADLLDARHASKTITQIAFAAGFEDAAHFTRAFKKQYHCTPREWRDRAGQLAAASEPAAEE